MSRALVQNKVHHLERKNPQTGQMQRITYLGSLRDKPQGWRVVSAPRGCADQAMGAEAGTV